MRASSYHARPPERFLELKETLTSQKFYLISTSGPTVFKIRDEEGNAFKVVLGNPHTCNCKASKDCCDALLCIHKVFCLLKVVRILETSPMSWQTSMTDAEIVQMLDGVYSAQKTLPKRVRQEKARGKEGDTENLIEEGVNKVQRQPVQYDSEEDICPICQDTMAVDQALTWCRVGCGNNMHAKCMILYAQHKNSKKDTGVLCPLCRLDWGPSAMQHIREDSRSSELKYSCAAVTCISCHVPLRGIFYRCIECSQTLTYQSTAGTRPHFDTCQRCFESPLVEREHRTHHMLKANATHSLAEHTWEPVVRQKSSIAASEEFLRSLQSRDFDASDYDLLLSLDANTTPSLATFIAEALRTASNPRTAILCWCGRSIFDACRVLTCCGAVVHEPCLIQRVNEAQAEGDNALSGIKCPDAKCKRSILLGLCRKRTKKKAKESNKQSNTDMDTKRELRDVRGLVPSNTLTDAAADFLQVNVLNLNGQRKPSGIRLPTKQNVATRKGQLQPLQLHVDSSSNRKSDMNGALSIIHPGTGSALIPPLIHQSNPETSRIVLSTKKKLQKFGLRGIVGGLSQLSQAGGENSMMSCGGLDGIGVSSIASSQEQSNNSRDQCVDKFRSKVKKEFSSSSSGTRRSSVHGVGSSSGMGPSGLSTTRNGLEGLELGIAASGGGLVRGGRASGTIRSFNARTVSRQQQQQRSTSSAPSNHRRQQGSSPIDLHVAPPQPLSLRRVSSAATTPPLSQAFAEGGDASTVAHTALVVYAGGEQTSLT